MINGPECIRSNEFVECQARKNPTAHICPLHLNLWVDKHFSFQEIPQAYIKCNSTITGFNIKEK